MLHLSEAKKVNCSGAPANWRDLRIYSCHLARVNGPVNI